jgi:methylamine dehydrogenase accessory protein MauD
LEVALLVARLLLAGVFLVAGVAKLADRAGSRQAIVDFGLPARLATPLGIVLPLAELAVAVALIPVSTAWWGALGALALLLLFTAGIGINLARGRQPECHCFGQLHSAPAGWSTLFRNGALAGVSGYVLWEGREGVGPSALSWLGALSTAELSLFIGGLLVLGLLAAVAWFLVHLLRQNGRLLVRLEALEQSIASGEGPAPAQEQPAENGAQQAPGLPVGTQAPTFSLQGLYSETLTLEALRAPGKPVMLLFTDPNCGPCNALLPGLSRWQQEHAQELTISLISRGNNVENRTKSSEHGLTSVLLQKDWEISEAYQVSGTPSAVLIQPDGTIGSSVVAGSEEIESLVTRTVGRSAPELPMQPQAAAQGGPCPNCGQVHASQPAVQAAEKIGEPAPPIKLKDLGGRTVELNNFRGEKVLVLFWNPGCGFCQQMLDDLKDFEANPPEGAPKLLIVSSGTVEDNKALGLRSPVLTDQQMTVGGAFGTYGTPTAVLVDEQGSIASGVAEGAQAVFGLAGSSNNGQVPAQQAVPASPKIGEPAPRLKLPDLKGKKINLAGFKGQKTLVLFWNPQCGFCQQMLDDLKALEAEPPEGTPKILVVSAGTVEANKAMGLRSTVVLDQEFATGRAFGTNGTPTAVLIDEQGRVASEVAAGAPAVLALARAGQQTEA